MTPTTIAAAHDVDRFLVHPSPGRYPVTSPQSPATPTEGTRTTTAATDLGYTKNPLPAVAESTSAEASTSSPLSEQDLAWMDELAPKCRIPFRDMTPDGARKVRAFAAMWFVPALTEVHRLRAAIRHYADQRKRYPRSGAEMHAFGKLVGALASRAEGAGSGDDVDSAERSGADSRSTPAPAVAAAPLATDADAGGETTQAESLAQRFHETYERLAPSFGYQTREASAKPWADVPENNRRLMTAVCAEILAALAPAPSPATTGEGLDDLLNDLAYSYMAKGAGFMVPGVARLRVESFVASLLARVAQAEQDAARLDWLDKQRGAGISVEFGSRMIWHNDSKRPLRASIDAARATPTTETDR